MNVDSRHILLVHEDILVQLPGSRYKTVLSLYGARNWRRLSGSHTCQSSPVRSEICCGDRDLAASLLMLEGFCWIMLVFGDWQVV